VQIQAPLAALAVLRQSWDGTRLEGLVSLPLGQHRQLFFDE
jgi:hypothetical protein